MGHLDEAQAAIVAMLKECGLSQVIITHDGNHNRYSKRGSNVYHTFETLAELHDTQRPLPKFRQSALLD